MKELSIEEKAKAYDEALERARVWKDKSGMPKNKQGILDDIFPELKESEDERVRKALLEMVHDTTGDELWVDYNVHKENALAWLEKQGEVESDNDDIEVEEKGIREAFNKIEDEKQCKQKPQRMISAEAKEAMYNKPAWSEEDEYMLESIVSGFAAGHKSSIGQDKWLKSLKARYTWKPSDEQMDALHYVTNFDYGGHKATLVSLYEQLKKLKG